MKFGLVNSCERYKFPSRQKVQPLMGHNPDAHSVIGVFHGSGRLACDGSSRYTLAEGAMKRLSTKASVPMYRKPSGPWQAHVGVASANTLLGKNARITIDPSGITSSSVFAPASTT